MRTEEARDDRRTHGIRIASVTTESERRAVARLRYEVYVEELEYDQQHADHRASALSEPQDERSVVFGAFEPDGTAVGTLRVTRANESDPEYGNLFGWRCLSLLARQEHAMASKLIVAKQLRGGTLALRIIRSGVAWLVRNRIRYCHLETYDHLLLLYSKLGFVTQGVRTHEPFGKVSHLRLDLKDVKHAKVQRSPLLDLLERPEASGFPVRRVG